MKKISIILPLLLAPLVSSCACVYNNGIKEQTDYSITAVKFNVDSLSIRVGNEKSQLIVSIEAEGEYTDAIKLSFKDEGLATLSASEVKSDEPFFITATKAGETTLTAVAKGDSSKSATIAIKVLEESPVIAVESVSLDKETESLYVGKTLDLVASVSPANATNQMVSWATSDESIATVNDGVVSGVKAGEAIIQVTTVDGGKTAQCKVSVTKELKVDGYYLLGTPNEWSANGQYELEKNDKNSSGTEYMIKFSGKVDDEFKVAKYNSDKTITYYSMSYYVDESNRSGVTDTITDSVEINYGDYKNIHIKRDGNYTLYFDIGIHDSANPANYKYWVDVGQAQ